MPFDETLRRSLDALARDLTSAVETERAAAAAAAREAAEQDAAASLARAEAAAAQRGREEAQEAGFDEARREGEEAGRQQGFEDGRQQGFEDGRQQGFEVGRQQGFDDGRQRGFDDGRQRGFDDGRQRGFDDGRQQGFESGRQEGFEASRDEAASSGNTVGLATSQRLADAMRAIDRARSLSEILDTLVSCAGRETARAAVLLVQGSQLRGWRFIGFDSALDEGSRVELSLAESGIIADAVSHATTTSADSAVAGSAPSFARLPPGRELLAVPVPLGGQVVAVLYGDQGAGNSGEREARFAWPATLEVMARHAARCLEVITAFRAAQVLTEQRGKGADRLATSPTSLDDDQAARRYARLLVSEIKLYHEPDVVAGRRDRDLGMRLGGEIARARVLYEQRIPAHLRTAADYFHEELVRTLADGDESLLKSRV